MQMSLPVGATPQLCACFKRQKLSCQATILKSPLPVVSSWHRFEISLSLRSLPGVRKHSIASWKRLSRSKSRYEHFLRPVPASSTSHIQHLGTPGYSKVLHSNPAFLEAYSSDHGANGSIQISLSSFKMKPSGGMHRAIVAFGSNIGNRVAHIENALDSMRRNGIKILKLSRLYETKAMYVENQPSFINGVVAIETNLEPLALLDLLQRIELDHGRIREIAKGPRTLDLDIILFDEELIDHERLKVPHPLMMEREFVLRPLADVISNYELSIPSYTKISNAIEPRITVKQALRRVTSLSQPMYPVTELFREAPAISAAVTTNDTRPHVMSILNITPDSFSDGGRLTPNDIETIIDTAKSHIASGATILDVGGQSTRPNAALISADDELARIVPALEAISRLPEISSGHVAISVDTFYASVARACSEKGLVDIINDVSGGMLDPAMLPTVAELNKTIILMHMRGTPHTMSSAENVDYTALNGVVPGVAYELATRVTAALDAGIAPWRIILDPGIGFAKNMDGNLKLLKAGPRGIVECQSEVLAGYPWLVGPSRKGFVGKITGVKKASERSWGTAACVTASVLGGADIVRVHDVSEMSSVVKMSTAISAGCFEE